MRQMTEENTYLWPQWLVYFAVADCDASIENTGKLGGKIILEPVDNSIMDCYIILKDPQGALFSILKPF